MATVESNPRCPVCGYDLDFTPWKGESAADEMCPCCGIQFGYDDFAGGQPELRPRIYAQWRDKWMREGMRWSSRGIEPPPGWNAAEQLRRIQT